MKRFIVYNSSGKILRTGSCPEKDFNKQAGDGEFVIAGIANDVLQKIVDGKIVDKTPEEIEEDKPPIIPEEQQCASITKKELKSILDRLTELEKKIKRGK